MYKCKHCQEVKTEDNYYSHNKATCKPCYIARSYKRVYTHLEENRQIQTRFRNEVSSPLAARVIKLFERMGESRRQKFAKWIMDRSTNAWEKAKRIHALDEWLAEYSGI